MAAIITFLVNMFTPVWNWYIAIFQTLATPTGLLILAGVVTTTLAATLVTVYRRRRRA